jgi:hypothetical protein
MTKLAAVKKFMLDPKVVAVVVVVAAVATTALTISNKKDMQDFLTQQDPTEI